MPRIIFNWKVYSYISCVKYKMQYREIFQLALLKLQELGHETLPQQMLHYMMNISQSQLSTKSYKLCSVMLKRVTIAKYICITIRHELHQSSHINSVASKGNNTLYRTQRNLKYCPQSTKEMAYWSLVRSALKYYAVYYVNGAFAEGQLMFCPRHL